METIPNHIKNVLTFKKLKPADKEFILNNFTTEMEDDIFPLNRIFDFDKIIPEPREESECPEDCKVNKDSHIMEYKDRPWFDWYTWHTRYWGTKWNCYDGYVKIGKSTITFVFSTAWVAPFLIYEQLANDYNFRFEVRYADEDIGSNCGYFNYEPNGETGEMRLYQTDAKDCCKDPVKFAERIWRNY